MFRTTAICNKKRVNKMLNEDFWRMYSNITLTLLQRVTHICVVEHAKITLYM